VHHGKPDHIHRPKKKEDEIRSAPARRILHDAKKRQRVWFLWPEC
jgi:hypothetical protein